MRAWLFGNTTVRNPYRLRAGLTVLANSSLLGNLDSREAEASFAGLLHREGVVSVRRVEAGEPAPADLGRKWRSAFTQLGLLTPKLSKGKSQMLASGIDPLLVSATNGLENLTGRPYELTRSGRNLVEAAGDSVALQQELLLRSVLAYQYPSVIEPSDEVEAFSPLRIVLKVLSNLEAEEDLDGNLTFEEFATVVQLLSSDSEVGDAVAAIRSYREQESQAPNRRVHRARHMASMSTEVGYRATTLGDYADTNIRYLKATGLVVARGRGIALAEDKRRLVDQLVCGEATLLEGDEYLRRLWQGAALPSDNAPEALQLVDDLANLLARRGIQPELPPDTRRLDIRQLSALRHRLENEYLLAIEEEFAGSQRSQWSDIVNYMRDLARGTRSRLVPHGEGPAYLEWVVWRGFLAINSIVNHPSEARRFQVDRDLRPITTAPGGGPDMVFEFDDFVLVVEVTLTVSSRQEAAEGEPVRRHVAKYVQDYRGIGKRVYGLFVANAIDSNTAATFSLGRWYLQDDSELALDIVPLTLAQFADILEATQGTIQPERLRQLLVECLAARNNRAPAWKAEIEAQVERTIAAHVHTAPNR